MIKPILDVLGGVVIFLTLGVTLITYLHYLRPAGGDPIFDLDGLFNRLKTNPADYWWLLFMLFSTLIPTVIHLMMGIYSAFLHWPQKLRTWIATRLEAGGNGEATLGFHGSWAYCALIAVSFWAPIIIVANVAWWVHTPVLNSVIAFFHGYYNWLSG